MPFRYTPLMHRTLLLSSIACFALPAFAHEAGDAMAKAANDFLAALKPEQKAQATFPFESETKGERLDWHFIPKERKGLPIKAMSEEQRALAKALLKTGLSDDGYQKAEIIQGLESVLREMEKDTTGKRDPEKYFVTIFGTPGGKDPWGWRWEGHHQSFNYTIVGKTKPAMTPSFYGSNPGVVQDGPKKGTRVLGKEEDLGRALVKSLDDTQRKKAVIMAEAPKDILNVPGRSDTKPEGLPYGELKPEQQKQLVELVKVYLFRCRPDVAAEDWAKIEKQGLDKLHFAWAGGFELGQPHYYRVQAGDFVVEYDNVQNGANHPHSVWRDFSHDFGLDVLAEHHKTAHGVK
jgi:hypothetical protein